MHIRTVPRPADVRHDAHKALKVAKAEGAETANIAALPAFAASERDLDRSCPSRPNADLRPNVERSDAASPNR